MREEPVKQSKLTTFTTIICLLLTVASVVGVAVFKVPFYLGSLAAIIFAMIPFFVSFEGKRPQARELVILAVMCAIAVASRVAFFWLPQFKPMAAIVMITGIALGAQSGFLCGVISILVSNFMFGQGYWTVWQMLAFGLAGLVFGALADRGIIKRQNLSMKAKVALSIGGGAFVLVIMGPILDTSSLIMFANNITPARAIAVYLAGVPFGLIHAAATVLTLFLVANPILDKLAYVRKKHGLMSGQREHFVKSSNKTR